MPISSLATTNTEILLRHAPRKTSETRSIVLFFENHTEVLLEAISFIFPISILLKKTTPMVPVIELTAAIYKATIGFI